MSSKSKYNHTFRELAHHITSTSCRYHVLADNVHTTSAGVRGQSMPHQQNAVIHLSLSCCRSREVTSCWSPFHKQSNPIRATATMILPLKACEAARMKKTESWSTVLVKLARSCQRLLVTLLCSSASPLDGHSRAPSWSDPKNTGESQLTRDRLATDSDDDAVSSCPSRFSSSAVKARSSAGGWELHD